MESFFNMLPSDFDIVKFFLNLVDKFKEPTNASFINGFLEKCVSNETRLKLALDYINVECGGQIKINDYVISLKVPCTIQVFNTPGIFFQYVYENVVLETPDLIFTIEMLIKIYWSIVIQQNNWLDDIIDNIKEIENKNLSIIENKNLWQSFFDICKKLISKEFNIAKKRKHGK